MAWLCWPEDGGLAGGLCAWVALGLGEALACGLGDRRASACVARARDTPGVPTGTAVLAAGTGASAGAGLPPGAPLPRACGVPGWLSPSCWNPPPAVR